MPPFRHTLQRPACKFNSDDKSPSWIYRTVNWQQISMFYFQSFCYYSKHHNCFFFRSLLPNDRERQIWKYVVHGQRLLNRGRGKKIKGKSDQGEICGSCLPVQSTHTTECEGDCPRHTIYERSKAFLALLCIPQTLSIMHFSGLPGEHICTHPIA